MINKLKTMSIAGAVLALSFMFVGSANAVIVPIDANVAVVNDVSNRDLFLFNAVVSDSALIQTNVSFEFNFEANGPVPLPATALQGALNIGTDSGYTGGVLTWVNSNDSLDVINTVNIADKITPGQDDSILLRTLFEDPLRLQQTVILTFATLFGDVSASLQVQAVPIPPALALFLSSLLGLGFLSRRRRKKLTPAMV